MTHKTIKRTPLAERWNKAFEKNSPYRFAVANKFSNPSTPDVDWMPSCLDSIQNGQSAQVIELVQSRPALLFMAHQGKTLLDAAWASKSSSFAFELLKLGAWASLSPNPTQRPALSNTPFEERLAALHADVAKHSPDALSLEMADKAIRASGRPSLEWSEWITLSLSIGAFRLANDLCDRFGIQPGEDDAQYFLRATRNQPILFDLASSLCEDSCDGRTPGWKLIEKSKKHLDSKLVDAIWRHAIQNDRIERMADLVSWGAIPDQWTLSCSLTTIKQDAPPESISLLAEAAIHGAPNAFACLKNIPEAIEAAISTPPGPNALAQASVQDLCSLARLGINIGSVDSDGRNVLHHWALRDRDQPRNGWISVCKIRPELLHAKDAKGRSPVDQQAQQLRHNSKRLGSFQAMISKIERADLGKTISEASKDANPMARSNPRL